MARILDRSKPFGEIFWFDHEGRRFEQDWADFDGAGDENASVDEATSDDAGSGDVAPGDAPAAAPRNRAVVLGRRADRRLAMAIIPTQGNNSPACRNRTTRGRISPRPARRQE